MACPGCGSTDPPVLLGVLGRLVWTRCRACGIQTSRDACPNCDGEGVRYAGHDEVPYECPECGGSRVEAAA